MMSLREDKDSWKNTWEQMDVRMAVELIDLDPAIPNPFNFGHELSLNRSHLDSAQ
jgi:hypothetical protein